MAEKFRDEGRDILFFVDNIYRYTLAGTEVSALLGRMPSAVGYQPTLAEEMGVLQERITSTKTGSITSIQAVYVPADDLTDPSPATTFQHWTRPSCCRVTSLRWVSTRRGPAGFLQPPARPASRGRRALPGGSWRAAERCSAGRTARHHRDSGHGRTVAGRQAGRGPRARSSASCRSPSTWPRCSPARRASTCRWPKRSVASR